MSLTLIKDSEKDYEDLSGNLRHVFTIHADKNTQIPNDEVLDFIREFGLALGDQDGCWWTQDDTGAIETLQIKDICTTSFETTFSKKFQP